MSEENLMPYSNEEEEEVEIDEMEGGKRKSKRRGNASLRAWVTFVKKVQKEEKLSYRDAMMRAKVRKDKGEKWMKGGYGADRSVGPQIPLPKTGGRRHSKRRGSSRKRRRTRRR